MSKCTASIPTIQFSVIANSHAHIIFFMGVANFFICTFRIPKKNISKCTFNQSSKICFLSLDPVLNNAPECVNGVLSTVNFIGIFYVTARVVTTILACTMDMQPPNNDMRSKFG